MGCAKSRCGISKRSGRGAAAGKEHRAAPFLSRREIFMTMAQLDHAPILKVENLAISYATRYGDVEAVRQVSFEVGRASTFGLVGESGCGKSTVAFGIVDF